MVRRRARPLALDGQPLLPLDAAQRADAIAILNGTILPAKLAQLERLLAHGNPGPYVCGARLSIADLNLYVYACGVLDGTGVPAGVSNRLLDGCPRVLAHLRAIDAHPAVVAWNGRPEAHAMPRVV